MKELSDHADALEREVVGLRADVRSLADRQTRAELRLVWVAIAAVIALALAAAIVVTAQRGAATDQRLDAFCPVLALVVGGYDPSTRAAGPARERYEASFQVMRRSYDDLGCASVSPLVPRRTS